MTGATLIREDMVAAEMFRLLDVPDEWLRARMHPSARFPFAYIHEDCGYPAFYLRRAIPYGADLRSKDAATLDGEPMRRYSPCTCGHCGGQLPMPPKTAHIQELLPS